MYSDQNMNKEPATISSGWTLTNRKTTRFSQFNQSLHASLVRTTGMAQRVTLRKRLHSFSLKNRREDRPISSQTTELNASSVYNLVRQLTSPDPNEAQNALDTLIDIFFSSFSSPFVQIFHESQMTFLNPKYGNHTF